MAVSKKYPIEVLIISFIMRSKYVFGMYVGMDEVSILHGNDYNFHEVRRMSLLGCVETMNPSILY